MVPKNLSDDLIIEKCGSISTLSKEKSFSFEGDRADRPADAEEVRMMNFLRKKRA